VYQAIEAANGTTVSRVQACSFQHFADAQQQLVRTDLEHELRLQQVSRKRAPVKSF
jgi:hypothetical protein